jgi:3D (Asp-Asp-Asp) domain-containing protein
LPVTNIRLIAVLTLTTALPAIVFADAAAGTLLPDRERSSSGIHRMTYTVRPGDTLYALSRRFGTRVETLMAVNRILDPRALPVGAVLDIPVPYEVADTSAQPELVCTLTAYSDSYTSTGKHPGDPGYGITASGAKATEGRTVAVDPSIIPLGSVLYIEGVGVRIAEDTGGAIKGDRIDVFFNSDEQALDFGVKKNVPVYILHVPPQSAFSRYNIK